MNEYWAKLTGDVAQWLEETELKSEDPGFDPLAGQVEKVFLTLRVNSCADLFVPDSPSCVWHAHTFVTPQWGTAD